MMFFGRVDMFRIYSGIRAVSRSTGPRETTILRQLRTEGNVPRTRRPADAMNRIEAISFDLDGTLFDHERASRLAIAAVCHAAGTSFERFFPVFHEENLRLWDAYGRGEINAGAIRAGRFERTLDRLGLDPSQAGQWAEPYLDIYARLPFLIPGAMDILETLSGRTRLAIVTNGYLDVQTVKLDLTGLRRRFDVVVTSEEVGEAKPSPKAFLRAAESLGLPPSAILHVGDSLAGDVRGAENAGMSAIWFRPEPGLDAAPEGVDTVSDLCEIVGRLETEPVDGMGSGPG
jgi:putative hydrolase of the HAD superfamily